MIWLYTIKFKSEAFEVFKKFKTLIKNEIGKSIKVLRTRGNREYTSNDFDSFYISEGIIHEVTSPYTSHYNGLAERKNGTILDIARSMRKHKSMPHIFWG